jgi:beta-glucanase (GH16 family)
MKNKTQRWLNAMQVYLSAYFKNKNFLTLIVMLFAISSNQSLKAQELYDLFIVAGQSNAQGLYANPSLYPQNSAADAEIKFFWHTQANVDYDLYRQSGTTSNNKNGNWVNMGLQNHFSPRNPCNPNVLVNEYYGPEVILSRKLKQEGYNPAIFKFAQSGSSVDSDWMQKGEGGLYDKMISTLNSAITALETGGNVVNIRGLIWIQGEGDSFDEIVANAYENKLKNIINDFRNDMQIPYLPVVLGVNETYGIQYSYIQKIVTAQTNIASGDVNITRTSMAGLDKCDNNNHLSSAGIHAQGERIHENYMKLVNNPTEDPNWEMIWNDEFNEVGNLDKNKWVENHVKSWYTGRHQEWWNKANVSLEADVNGIKALVLKAEKEDCPYPSDDGSHKEYSSGEISTKGLEGNFKYGYFEASVKVPYGQGFFPSFWLSIKNGENFTYPPELDIFEYSGKGDYLAHGTNQRLTCEDNGYNTRFMDRGYYISEESNIKPYDNYRIYGMEWNEHEIKFYIDNEIVGRTLTEEVPHDFLRIVLSLQLAYVPSAGLGDLSEEDKKMYVDWVRVHKLKGAPVETDYDKWDRIWFNSTSGALGEFNLNPGDIHVSGNFDGKENDEILSIAKDDIHAKMHRYIVESSELGSGLVGDYVNVTGGFNGGNAIGAVGGENAAPNISSNPPKENEWYREWGNEQSGKIGVWNLRENVQYVSGNFDVSNDLRVPKDNITVLNQGVTQTKDDIVFPKDELLCIGNQYVMLNEYNDEFKLWYNKYDNDGSSWLGQTFFGWNTGSGDSYLVFDFNNDGADDVLCFSSSSVYCKLLTYNEVINNWDVLFSNGASSKIIPESGVSQSWNLSANDIYKVGDFNGNGLGELLIINATNGCSKHYEFNNGSNKWKYLKGNVCSGKLFDEWNMDVGAKYHTYESVQENRTKLFCVSPGNKYEKIISFNNNTWSVDWGNRGSYQIYNRDIEGSDQFFFGNYSNNENVEAVWVKQAWTSYYYDQSNVDPTIVDCNTIHAYLHELPEFENKKSSERVKIQLDELNVEKRISDIKIFPNPSNGQVFVQGENIQYLEILNIRGQVIGKPFITEGDISIDMSSNTSGVYFIRIISNNEASMHKLILE